MKKKNRVSRLLSLLLVLALALSAGCGALYALEGDGQSTGGSSEGGGTDNDDPDEGSEGGEPAGYDEPSLEDGVYIIETASELMWFREHVNSGARDASALLAADIDMQGYSWNGIGRDGFSGVFDGGGRTIKNLTGSEGLVGLNEGTVKNVRLLSVDVARAGGNLGAVAGVNAGTVSCCFAGGSVGGLLSGERIGGIVGLNEGRVTGCVTDCTVSGETAGGLVGVNGEGGSFDGCLYFGSCPKLEGENDDERGDTVSVFLRNASGVVIDYASSASVPVESAVAAVNDAIERCGGVFELTDDFLKSLEGTTGEGGEDIPKYYYTNCAGVRVETDDPSLDGYVEPHTGGAATYTERARCERCGAEYGELLADATPPEVTILFGDSSVTGTGSLPSPAFFSSGECVFKVRVNDEGLGADGIEYTVSDAPTDFEAENGGGVWTAVEQGQPIRTDGGQKGYLYVRARDRAGNVGFAAAGFVSDAEQPAIEGADEGEYLSESARIRVSDNNLTLSIGDNVFPEHAVKVTVNGLPVALDENGEFALSGFSGACEIRAVDCAGNAAARTVNVISGDYTVNSYTGSGGAVTVTLSDRAGSLVKRMVFSPDGSGVTTEYGAGGVTETAVGADGKVTRVLFTANDGTTTSTVYQKDGSSSVTHSSPSGKVVWYSAVAPDGSGVKTEYRDDGTTVVTRTSSGGSVTEHTTHYPDGSFKTDGFIPIMVAGSGAKYTGDAMAFRSDDEYVNFLRVTVNGETLSQDLYTVHKGSIVVTLKDNYLKGLEPGSYTLGIVSTNGSAMGIFTIPAPEAEKKDEQTSAPLGDGSPVSNGSGGAGGSSGSSTGGGHRDNYLSSVLPSSGGSSGSGVTYVKPHGSTLTGASGSTGVVVAIATAALLLIVALVGVALAGRRRDEDEDDGDFEFDD